MSASALHVLTLTPELGVHPVRVAMGGEAGRRVVASGHISLTRITGVVGQYEDGRLVL